MAGELEGSPDARLQLAIALMRANPKKYCGDYNTPLYTSKLADDVKAYLKKLDGK
jgi:hypothetical protein